MSGRTEHRLAERVFIGLGGNIGDPRHAMASAVNALAAADGIDVVGVSSLYRTPPWGKTDQPDFLNAVVEIRCSMTPRELLNLCLEIERGLKRKRRERWGPRIIDMDIIAFGNRAIEEPDLHIPHPRLHERAFVLTPFAEIAPDFAISGRRVSQLLAELNTRGIALDTPGPDWLDAGGARSD